MRIDEQADTGVSAEGLRVAVVTASFNAVVTTGLKEGALAFLEAANATEILSVDVPGAFELPLAALAVAQRGYDAVVCLGAVIEGDTDHYEHIAHRASEGIMRAQLDTGVPMAFGILTVRNAHDALVRSQPGPDNKGREAAEAVVVATRTLQAIRDT